MIAAAIAFTVSAVVALCFVCMIFDADPEEIERLKEEDSDEEP